ncbi:MAG TPA: hypothetical protein VKU02_33930 [Gemmataceae bacterium]|nr:hypothetical protein [Gemmataceae bacterium]
MRNLALACMAAGLLLFQAAAGKAQPRIQIRIESIQVGFGSSAPIAEFKSGFWAPVYVTVMAGPEGTPRGEVIIESVDSDDVPNHYTIPLPQLGPNDQETVLGFTKPGSATSEVTARVRIDDRIVATKEAQFLALQLDQQLYLALGANLPGLRTALNPASKADAEDSPMPRENNPRRLLQIDDIRMLPNRWFAYDAVDLLILSTGNRDFVTSLLNEREGRKEALAEWVRRGGRLLLSVGRNQDLVSKLDVIQAMLPVSIDGALRLPRVRSVAKWSGAQYSALESPANAKAPIILADLKPKPGRETETLLEEQDGTRVIQRGAYGLGRVTVVALDLDQQSPFAQWAAGARKEFWLKLLDETAPRLPPQPSNQRPGYRYGEQQGFDRASQLQMNLEDFEDVPVISFGWVALFILLYILVVGPLDYFFLKKVLKRLELTWITFPTVVITISVAAYFTAYWLKGNDQRVNKVDLLDVDLHTQQLVGNTWFTIFSPRIQHYTIGLEPASSEWVTTAASSGANASVVLSWMARPEMSYGGTGRAQSQGLFRRAYEYLPDANGLVGVPIQVWSTKSFAASWQAPLDRAQPIISADLQRSKESSLLSGKITSRLPVDLEDVVIYTGIGGDAKWYSLGRLVPDGSVTVANIHAAGREAMSMEQWLEDVPAQYRRNAAASRLPYATTPADATITVVKGLLFHQFDRKAQRNNALRFLDQSWRLRHKDEVVLFGRIPRQEGAAETLTAGGAAPTRLWLGSMPAMGQARPPLSGTLTQETFVRMIIPIRTAN